jgi:hypothetical protein
MYIAIYRGSEIVLNVNALSGSQLSRKLNGEDVCQITIALTETADLRIGDYIEVFGRRYTLNVVPDYIKKSNRNYQYDLIFESRMYDLRKVQYMDGISGDFILTGDLSFFVTQLVTNANRIFQGWSVGSVAGNTETKTLQFSNENCLAVLQRLSDEYKLDFRVSEDKTISVDTFTQEAVHSFSYGKGNGLYQLTRKKVDSKDVITRLYVYGGTRNIPANYRNYSTRLKIEGDYIESNVDKYGIIERAYNFDDIYPRFTGAITSVTDYKTFRCTDINFDINAQLMPGTSAKVHFNTGLLAGYEFEIVSYDNDTKEVVLKQLDQEKSVSNAGTIENYILPNDTQKPDVGDSFVFIDIIMPQWYITHAEDELLAKGTEYLHQNDEPHVLHALDVDPIYMKQTAITLDVGDYVNVKDTPLGVDQDIQITALTRNLETEHIWKFDLSDSLAPQRFTTVVNDLENIKRLIVVNRLDDIARAKRNWRNSQELYSAVFDPDGYFDTDKIKPLSIETSMLSVGSKSGNLSTNCLIESNYGGNANSCRLGAGVVAHTALDNVWTITANTVNNLTPSAYYYIYAKCTKSAANTGILVLDTAQRKTDSDPTYYYFLLGILHSVFEGVRGISLTYGQAQINGKFIKGILTSDDGLSYLNVNTGEYVGKITFRSGKTDTQIETSISSAQSDADYAQTVADSALANAAAAQTSANNALTYIANVVSDNILSPVEKSGERSRWNTSASEKAGIDSQATTFGITTEKTAYDNAFQALANYLNNGTAWSSGVPAWIADSNLSVNTTIVGGTYRTTWETFLNAKTALLNAIAAKAKALADAAQSDADYAQTVADSALTNAATAQAAATAAQTTATNAQTAATNAQTSANTANALINDIASDDKVTASEKSAIKKEFDTIQAEVINIDTQAYTFGISRTNYDNSFYDLYGYIGSNLNSLTSTWDLGTNGGSTLRQKFITYYTQRTSILNAIAAKAKTLADAAQADADYAQTVADSALTNAANAYNLADSKHKNFTAQPTTPYKVGDTWDDGTDHKTCVVQRLTGNFNAADWAKRVNYDSTQVTIDNGIVSAGSFRVKDANNVEWGGMRGATGTAGTEVGLWLGASMANRATANFRVTHNGDAYFGSATIKSNGTFTGNSRLTAQLYNGLLQLGIETSGSFGKTIEINGNTRIIEIAQTEPGDSSFFQDMAILKGNVNVLSWAWNLAKGERILATSLRFTGTTIEASTKVTAPTIEATTKVSCPTADAAVYSSLSASQLDIKNATNRIYADISGATILAYIKTLPNYSDLDEGDGYGNGFKPLWVHRTTGRLAKTP